MQKAIIGIVATASLIALGACNKQSAANSSSAANAINGTWKADVNTVQFNSKPDEFLVQNGSFSCKSCTPPYSVPADGAFHPVSLPYADSDSVKVVDDHTVTETVKKAGREVGSSTYSVSADGKTLDGQFTDSSAPGAVQKGEFIETRVAAGPAGAHALSGQWKPTKLANYNDAALTVTLNVNGDTYQSTSPAGTSFEATIGGGDVPIKGDIAGTTVSVKKVGDNSYQETDKRGGKVVSVTTVTAGADGKLTGVSVNKLNDSTTRWTANKQS